MIRFAMTEELYKALKHNNIKPEDYQPAYDGTSVALDIYNAGPDLNVLAGRGAMLPSGLHLDLPHGYAALVMERGSISKTPLIRRAGVGDPDYTGQYFVSVWNLAETPGFGDFKKPAPDITIPQYAKTPFQIMVVPVVNKFSLISMDEYKEVTAPAKRQAACLGSSDMIKAEPPTHTPDGKQLTSYGLLKAVAPDGFLGGLAT